MHKYISLILFIIFSATFSAHAAPDDLPTDATPEEKAVYNVFSKHCARCHQDGKLENGLNNPKKDFGHVLELRTLAEDPQFVFPGDPLKSKINDLIGEYSYPRMPDDCKDDACYPNADEEKAISDWIKSLSAGKKEREFISLSSQISAAFSDLQKTPTHLRSDTRYISLRIIHNDPAVSTDALESYRQATVKLLNALSWNPNSYKFQSVDENNILLRVYLPDLDWSTDTWDILEADYPYGIDSDVDPNLAIIKSMTKSDVPIIRADWLSANATQPPLYHEILKLPDTFSELEKMLDISTLENILANQVVRAGFQDSGVSTHNRLIERHTTAAGIFWTSYDFAGSKGRQSFFDYPLGPASIFPKDVSFLHDGGESIFSLPNGFHAYYLNTADGKRLDVGPTEIVRDDDYKEGTGEVVNGISCISCHANGINKRSDEVRDIALNNMSINAKNRQLIDALYPGNTIINELLNKDEAAFFDALKRAGIEPSRRVAGREPIRGMFIYYEDAFVDFSKAANELGLKKFELKNRIAYAGELGGFLTRLERSPVARDQWENVFSTLLTRLTDYFPVTKSPNHQTQIVSDEKNVRHEKLKHSEQVAVISNSSSPLHLSLKITRQKVKVDDLLSFHVEADKRCELQILYVVPHDNSVVEFPQSVIGPAFLEPGEVRRIPFKDSKTRIRFDTPGEKEMLYAYCRVGGLGTNRISVDEALSYTKVSRGISFETASQVTEDSGLGSADFVVFRIDPK